ncbi:MAG: AtpZ/AtpI family protein [Epsilonproteobacteria bacterium]|nr:AtpZ/AtpI family protein [Campylobacterota bacterium]
MEEKPKYGKIIEGAEQLSLGISMVVAVLIGVALGIGLKNLFGIGWLFWIGVFIGIAAAILNVYKAYKKQKKELDKLKDDVRYKHYQYKDDDDDDDIKY